MASSNPNILDSAQLAPAKAFALTPIKPSTESDSALGYLQSHADAFNQSLLQLSKDREQASNDSLQMLLKGVLEAPGKTELTNAAYSRTVDPAESELRDINDQIVAEQHALDRRLQALDKNPHGLFGGALEQEKQDAKDASLARQADLSIIQMAKQGKYDSAKAIADRAIAAQYERQQNENKALELNYQENKDLFSKAESRAFESMLADRKSQLDLEMYKKKADYDQLIKQSDPLYLAQVANTRRLASGVSLSGGGGSAALVKLTPGQKNQITDLDSLGSVANSALSLGQKINWAGVGGLGKGTISQFLAKNFGTGTTEQQQLRNYIGNLQATLAKERGGTSFTNSEKALLQTYTPTINDSPKVIEAKITNLNEFLAQKRSSIISIGAGDLSAPAASADPLGLGL